MRHVITLLGLLIDAVWRLIDNLKGHLVLSECRLIRGSCLLLCKLIMIGALFIKVINAACSTSLSGGACVGCGLRFFLRILALAFEVLGARLRCFLAATGAGSRRLRPLTVVLFFLSYFVSELLCCSGTR